MLKNKLIIIPILIMVAIMTFSNNMVYAINPEESGHEKTGEETKQSSDTTKGGESKDSSSGTSNTGSQIKTHTIDDIIGYGEDFLSAGNSSSAITFNESGLKSLSDTVSGILLTIAIAVTFISTIVMGINFAVQSAEDKAKIKESMIPWIIGIFISFGAFGIWKITMTVFYSL